MKPTRNISQAGSPPDGAPTPARPNGSPAASGRAAAAPAADARRLKPRRLFEAVAKPFEGFVKPVWHRLPRRWRSRVWAGAVLAGVLVRSLTAAAQEPVGPPPPPPANEPFDAEELAWSQGPGQSNDFNQGGEPGRAAGLPETNHFAPAERREPLPANAAPAGADQPGATAQSASTPAPSPLPPGPAAAGDRAPTNTVAEARSGPARPDYAAFKLIADRNIFDPNRVPHRPDAGPRTRPKVTESFALVGTMSYEKGTFAFFDGSSSEYRKVLKPADEIASYKLTDIAPNAVKLAAGTNELELRVGMQLHREEGGDWLLATQAEPYAASASASATNTGAAPETAATQPGASSGGDLSELEKRMMQRREQQ